MSEAIVQHMTVVKAGRNNCAQHDPVDMQLHNQLRVEPVVIHFSALRSDVCDLCCSVHYGSILTWPRQNFTDCYFKQLTKLFISTTVDTSSQRYEVGILNSFTNNHRLVVVESELGLGLRLRTWAIRTRTWTRT